MSFYRRNLYKNNETFFCKVSSIKTFKRINQLNELSAPTRFFEQAHKVYRKNVYHIVVVCLANLLIHSWFFYSIAVIFALFLTFISIEILAKNREKLYIDKFIVKENVAKKIANLLSLQREFFHYKNGRLIPRKNTIISRILERKFGEKNVYSKQGSTL